MPALVEAVPQDDVETVKPDHQTRNRVLIVLLALAGVWLASPMLTSYYVEAYVARLQSMALLLHHGTLRLDDQAYPMDTELLYVTRLGMVWLLDGAMVLFHSTSLLVLRVITLASLALLTGSSMVFVRRWTKLSGWWVLAGVVLTPGILEASFFFADNLVSAALAALALSLVTDRVTRLRWACIGAAEAAAMLIRLDAVLVIPAIVAVLWLVRKEPRELARAALYAALGGGVIFGLSYALTGVSLPLAIRVALRFSSLNDNPQIYQTGLLKTEGLILLGFFGLISLPLLALGAWENYKIRGRRWSMVMTALPAMFYLVVIPHANEIRDFCLLGAPFVLLQTAVGLQCLVRFADGPAGRSRMLAWATFGWFGLVLIAPPYLSMRDGPRALVGRIYSPMFWREWQDRTSDMLESIQTTIERVRPGQRVLVITTQFEPERYLHLTLLQDGFQLEPVSTRPGCQSIERFRSGERMVVNIRTENPYGIFRGQSSGEYIESLQLLASLQCLQPEEFARTMVFGIGPSGSEYWPGLGTTDERIPRHSFMPTLRGVTYGFFNGVRLSSEDVQRLENDARDDLKRLPAPQGSPALDYADFQRRVQAHLWNPRAR